MDDYLTKPCTAAALEGMIAKWEAIAEAEDLPESRVGIPGGQTGSALSGIQEGQS